MIKIVRCGTPLGAMRLRLIAPYLHPTPDSDRDVGCVVTHRNPRQRTVDWDVIPAITDDPPIARFIKPYERP